MPLVKSSKAMAAGWRSRVRWARTTGAGDSSATACVRPLRRGAKQSRALRAPVIAYDVPDINRGPAAGPPCNTAWDGSMVLVRKARSHGEGQPAAFLASASTVTCQGLLWFRPDHEPDIGNHDHRQPRTDANGGEAGLEGQRLDQ